MRPLQILGNERGGLSGSTIGSIAGLVLSVALAFIFPPVGAPITFAYVATFAAIGTTVGGIAGGVVDFLTAADNINRQQQIANLQVQTSTYGTGIPQIFGAYRVAGNIIWIGPKIAHEVRHEQSKKGKGKGPINATVENTYSVSLAIAICDTQVSGPMRGIRSVWADSTLVSHSSGEAPIGPPGWFFHPGYADQEPDYLIAAHKGLANTPGYPFLCYVSILDYDMGQFPRVPNFTFLVEQENPNGMPLMDLAGNLIQAAGIPASQIDVGRLPATLTRFIITGVNNVRSALESLMIAHRFFLFERGNQIVAKTAALEDPVGHIDETELDAAELSTTETQGLVITRERNRTLPTQLTVTYPDPARDYQPNSQVAMFASREQIVVSRSSNTAVALDGSQAKALVQESLDRAWIERTAFQFSLSRRWARFEPGDRITVTSRNAEYAMTLQEINYARPGILAVQARGDSAMVFFVAGALPGTGPEVSHELPMLSLTGVWFLNLPALHSEDQAPRMHFIYRYPEPTGWPGATLHRSADSGESYQLVHVGSQRAYTGTATTVLPHAPAYLTDTTSTVTVVMEYGSMHTVTAAQFQAGAIHAYLGHELLQFRDAELIAPNTYVLSHFWRGRRGTKWATGLHEVGERFTLVDSAINKLELPLNERNVPRMWKAVTRGTTIDTATEYTYAMPSVNLRPWAVASIRVRHDDDDWVISWRGTARFNGAWVDRSQATTDPDFLSYRVVIFADATAAAIVRQVDVADTGDFQARQSYVYDATQQTTDFGSLQSAVYVQVYQVGRNDVSRPAAA